MSTDLHLHHDLPKLRISSSSSINNMESSNSTTTTTKSHIAATASSSSDDTTPSVVSSVHDHDAFNDDEESYRTPTSKESKIPAVLTCPPAPKKAKAVVSCKRKLLDEFQFFEVTNKEDMDAFFRSTFPKRTCPCT